jgi:hypothetical protein
MKAILLAIALAACATEEPTPPPAPVEHPVVCTYTIVCDDLATDHVDRLCGRDLPHAQSDVLIEAALNVYTHDGCRILYIDDQAVQCSVDEEDTCE